MILFPNAKINLGLDILRRRPDGYHDISTLFLPTQWCDILELLPAEPGSETTLSVTGRPVGCPPEKNLVMKAYHALASDYHLPPVDIRLYKVIPDGAGLGGGSADAAFTLIGLNELFSLNIPKEKLSQIAGRIGADCAYFVFGGAMTASGTGTTLTPSDFHYPSEVKKLVIVKPPVSMPTKEAYAGITPSLPAIPLERRLQLPLANWQEEIVNDFEESVFAKLPEVGSIKKGLIEMGALYASMSGSGTAVYALCGNDILAEEVKERFQDCDIHIEPLNN